MKHKSLYVILALTALFICCQQEELGLEKTKGMGRVVLSNSDIEVYTSDVQTRAILDNYSGFVFTLNGTTVEGWTVRDSVITFTNNEAVIEAGTYHLSANNDAASAPANGKGCANYSGQSSQFSLTIGGTANVTIGNAEHPLTPQNARVTLSLTSAFSTKYNNVRMTLTAGGRSVDLGNATGCETEAFFPAGSVSYTLAAAAITDSHVTDIFYDSGSITLTKGHHTVVSLTANPVTGEIIPIIEGSYSGFFD